MALGIRQRLSAAMGQSNGRHDAGLARVGWQLALQSIGLLAVMVVVLEAIVYIITQRTLIKSLETTLVSRSNNPPQMVCTIYRYSCGRGDGHGGSRETPATRDLPPNARSGPPSSSHPEPVPDAGHTPSEASLVFVDTHLKIVHADGALGPVVLSAEALQVVMRSRHRQCCDTYQYRNQPYLVLTTPLLYRNRVIGAVQASISQHEYTQTMYSLLQVLLIVALLGLLISGAISGLLVRRALTPIRVSIARQRDFVADAAHELRTPLAIQRTAGEVGMNEASIDDLQATVAQMLTENQHLTRLVEDLSLLARTDTNVVSIERSRVDLSALVVDTVTELQSLAETQGVALEMDVRPNCHTMGDVLRLRQLLLILMDNALKHTPQGECVQVRLECTGDRVRLQVVDAGPGINPRELKRIFDRFYRADRARTGEGMGLGLSIGKWIVEAHGGRIVAVNNAGQGATFSVVLPRVRPE